MNAPFPSTLSATIAFVLISVTAMGADAIPGAVGTAASPSSVPAFSSLDGRTFVAQATSIWTRERWYWKIKKEYW